jgi:hypothetical protein
VTGPSGTGSLPARHLWSSSKVGVSLSSMGSRRASPQAPTSRSPHLAWKTKGVSLTSAMQKCTGSLTS